MSFKIITIPFNGINKSFYADELNEFCINKRILHRKVEFFHDGGAAYWSVFLEYEPVLEVSRGEPKGLTEAGKLCYERLRAWRRETAEREGIPPFLIARNTHLQDIIEREIVTPEALKQVNGFGSKKVEKYGREITGIVRAFFKKKNEK